MMCVCVCVCLVKYMLDRRERELQSSHPVSDEYLLLCTQDSFSHIGHESFSIRVPVGSHVQKQLHDNRTWCGLQPQSVLLFKSTIAQSEAEVLGLPSFGQPPHSIYFTVQRQPRVQCMHFYVHMYTYTYTYSRYVQDISNQERPQINLHC